VFDCITKHRSKILADLAAGFSNREIAKRRHMSESTVRGHIQELCELTCCQDRFELGRWWGKHGYCWLKSLAQAGCVEMPPTPTTREDETDDASAETDAAS
jgi:DNA-binding CsgD family transcriptional regulator